MGDSLICLFASKSKKKWTNRQNFYLKFSKQADIVDKTPFWGAKLRPPRPALTPSPTDFGRRIPHMQHYRHRPR